MKSILEEASEIIKGDRREAYGPVKGSFGAISKVWTGILAARNVIDPTIRPKDVALMMIGLKLCREACKHSRDNLVDIHGYDLLLEDLLDVKD